jgi:hypothetical protein
MQYRVEGPNSTPQVWRLVIQELKANNPRMYLTPSRGVFLSPYGARWRSEARISVRFWPLTARASHQRRFARLALYNRINAFIKNTASSNIRKQIRLKSPFQLENAKN